MSNEFPVLSAETITPGIARLRLRAPRVARHWRPGQFVIVRGDDDGERIPLTVVETDPDGSIVLVIQAVGATTDRLCSMVAGDTLADVAGPLGSPSEVDRFGRVVVVAGGVGVAVALPVARALIAAGNEVTAILGARSADRVILAAETEAAGCRVIVATEDGSLGIHGMVTDALGDVLAGEGRVDRVFTAGPIPMMTAVAEATRRHGITTIASLNPIMVDGTGMCGGCRVRIAGEMRFACVDGPEFDAHAVDFDTLARRNAAYAAWEADARRGACREVPA